MEDKLKTRVDTNTDVSIKKRSEYGVKVDQNYTVSTKKNNFKFFFGEFPYLLGAKNPRVRGV